MNDPTAIDVTQTIVPPPGPTPDELRSEVARLKSDVAVLNACRNTALNEHKECFYLLERCLMFLDCSTPIEYRQERAKNLANSIKLWMNK